MTFVVDFSKQGQDSTSEVTEIIPSIASNALKEEPKSGWYLNRQNLKHITMHDTQATTSFKAVDASLMLGRKAQTQANQV